MKYYLLFQTVHQDPTNADDGQGCDANLKTEDGTVFHVNSELLSRHSKFFKSLFSIDEETGQSTVIHNIKRDIFEIILTYMSTGRVLLTTENVMHLLVASDFLMIESLVDMCRKFVLQNKKVGNLVSFFLTAKRIKGLDVDDQCRRLLVVCFEKAVMLSMDEVCCLPSEDLRYFLSHRSLNVSDEHTIWSVIEAWVQKDPVNRHPHVPGLLRCLSIDEIDDDLASNLISSPIIRNNVFYEDLGDPCLTLDFLSDKKKAQTLILFRNEPPIITEVRLPRSLHFVAKNLQDRDGAELFLSYDDSLDLWRKVGEIPTKDVERLLVSAHRVYFLKNVSYGFKFSGFYYDLLRNEVKSMALPSFSEYVVEEVGGRVYALKMFFGSTIQRYVDETDEWMDVRQMRQKGVVSGVLDVNGLFHVLLAIGTFTEVGYMSMKVCDPTKNRWYIVPSPTVRRISAISVVYESQIFLVGGVRLDMDDEADELISKDVEVYDPKTKEWAVYPELPFGFFPVLASVVKDRLYVYEDSFCPVVYWDGSGQWKIAENPSQLFIHNFCVVKDEDVVRKIMKRNKEEDPTVWLETGLEKEIM